MSKKIILTTLFLIMSVIYGEELLSTLEEYQTFAVNNNLDLLKSELDLEESREDIESLFKFDSTKLGINGNYKSEEFGYSALVTVPILEQLELSGSIDEESSGSIGLSISPFDMDTNSKKSELNYDVNKLKNSQTILDVQTSSMESALNWMVATNSLGLAELKSEYYETLYIDDKERYQSGTITLDELQDSFIDWSDAKKDLLSSRQSLSNSEFNLYSKLGTSGNRVELNTISIDELEKDIQKLKDLISGKDGSFTTSLDLQISEKNLEIEKINTDSIWFYDPNLSASLSWGFDEDGMDMSDFSASINFSINMDDFQASEQKRALSSYEISVMEYELETQQEEMELELLLNNHESNALETEIYKLEYEEAQLLLSEAELLYRSGEYSEMDLLNSSIFLKQAENSLFNALKSEYLDLLEYLKYI